MKTAWLTLLRRKRLGDRLQLGDNLLVLGDAPLELNAPSVDVRIRASCPSQDVQLPLKRPDHPLPGFDCDRRLLWQARFRNGPLFVKSSKWSLATGFVLPYVVDKVAAT